MKKILVILLILFSIIYIYILTIDKKIYYLAFNNEHTIYSDSLANYLKKSNKLEKYVKEFSDNNTRLIDYINFINDNYEINLDNKKVAIKNALIKADLITISFNINDIKYYINDINNYITYKKDMELFLSKIRQYSKEDIFVIGFLNINDNYKKLNTDLKIICKKYDIEYIDLQDGKEKIINKITSIILN